MKTIVFSAGGTLGHISPAISFIKRIKEVYSDIRVIFLATTKDESYSCLKTDLIDKVYYIETYGISKNIFKNIKNAFINLQAISKIKQILKEESVRLVVGMGGYISGLTLIASNKLKINMVIHEQNSVIGSANKIVLKYVDKVFTSFKNTYGLDKYQEKVKWIGNPRYDIKYNNNDSIIKDKKNILIMSGSLGSKKINEIAKEFLKDKRSYKYTITLITGKRYYDDVIKDLSILPHFKIKNFSDDVIKDIKRSGIVISRAGSSSCYELLGLTTPSILIPSPNVVQNHQYYNAKELQNDNLIYMLEEKDLSVDSLISAIEYVENNYESYIYNLEHYNIGVVCDAFIEAIDIYIKGE